MSELVTDHISFSQLTTAQECPYAYYLLKIAGVEPVQNAFAEAGSLAHKLLAGWAKGEIPLQELPVEWIKNFSKEVTTEFPHFLASKGYREKLFDAVLTYFEHFKGFPDCEVVGVEQLFTSSIAGEKFVGIIDLILRDKATGGLTIVDYKSCSLRSFKRNGTQMYRQLLLYGKHCADRYGEFPAMLRFELLKENVYDERKFEKSEYIAAREWAELVIQEMKDRDFTLWFSVNPDYFRCTNLCSCRHECRCGKPEFFRKDNQDEKRTCAVA